MASGRDFPFTIMDVAGLLRLNIRRRGGSRVVYADCPICGDRRGKLGLYPQIDTWRCYHCGECGGMLALYGKVHGVNNSDAYQEICDTLKVGASGREYMPKARAEPAPDVPQPQRASPQDIHRTLTALLAMLTLSPAHSEHLHTKRGLTDGEIAQFGFKSTPPAYQCRAIAAQLLKQGCIVEGVPGFYLDNGGKWRAKFHQRTSGIVIPLRGVDGLLQGLQIRLDHPIKKEDDPPGKTGIKYLPFTSTGKPLGVTSGNPIHFVGDPSSRVVYVTEGALKADIAHALTGRTFAATVGVNNTMGLDELFAFLHRNGTEEIVEAEDMDKYCNPNVSRGGLQGSPAGGEERFAVPAAGVEPQLQGDRRLAAGATPERNEEKGARTHEFQGDVPQRDVPLRLHRQLRRPVAEQAEYRGERGGISGLDL